MTDDVFNEDDNVNDSDTFLDQLVGEGRKFKSAEDLARGKAESDRYIEQLKTELENQKRLNEEKFDELLRTVKNKSAQTAEGNNSQTPDSHINSSRPSDVDNTSPNDAGGDLESLVKKTLKEQQDLTRKEANVQAVNQKLAEMYGEKAASVVKTRAEEMDMSLSSLKQMAETSPKAFLKLIAGEESKSTGLSGVQSRVNTESLGVSKPNSEQGWSYYRDLKKKNPAEFWKRHNEIYEKVQRVGADKFYNS